MTNDLNKKYLQGAVRVAFDNRCRFKDGMLWKPFMASSFINSLLKGQY